MRDTILCRDCIESMGLENTYRQYWYLTEQIVGHWEPNEPTSCALCGAYGCGVECQAIVNLKVAAK